MSGVGNSAESRMGNGRRVKERSTAEQEPVNFERVIFAEQVLKPMYAVLLFPSSPFSSHHLFAASVTTPLIPKSNPTQREVNRKNPRVKGCRWNRGVRG